MAYKPRVLTVSDGWTGQTTLTNHAILLGAGTSAISAMTLGTALQVVQSAGAGVDAGWSTATYPATTTANQLLYSSSANVIGQITTANSGVFVTGATGIPIVDITNFAILSTGTQIKGNNTNTTPPSGFIGETVRAYLSNSTTVALTSGVTTKVTSVDLTAGIWDVSGLIGYVTGVTCVVTAAEVSLSSTISNIAGNYGDDSVKYRITGNTAHQPVFCIPKLRVLLSSTTTYYLNTMVTYTTSITGAYGRISATRVG